MVKHFANCDFLCFPVVVYNVQFTQRTHFIRNHTEYKYFKMNVLSNTAQIMNTDIFLMSRKFFKFTVKIQSQ